MTDEIFEAQENIIMITKEKRGFLRPSSKELGLDIEWL